MLVIMWLGPFLGLLLRRGRGAALLSYGVVELAIAFATLGWWWGRGVSARAPAAGAARAIARVARVRRRARISRPHAPPDRTAEPGERKPLIPSPCFLSKLRKNLMGSH
jgi:hypothetical protein